MSVPVLLLIFNRPEHTRQVVEAIRHWDISRLYVAADGPREHVHADLSLCEETRRIVLDELSHLPIETLFRDTNLGCGIAVTSALDWFFTAEDRGVVLEDDCVPDSSFLPYCEELLERYEDDPKVMMISGNNFLTDRTMAADEYLFSRQTHVWGWATWRRAWQLNDFDMTRWPELRSSSWLLDMCGGDRHAERYWRWIFDRSVKYPGYTWDYPWFFSIWFHNGLSITPGRNLVRNIGFAGSATNTLDEPTWYRAVVHGSAEFPLRHPTVVHRDVDAELWTDRHVFMTHNVWYRLMRTIARFSNRLGLEMGFRRLYRAILRVVRSLGTSAPTRAIDRSTTSG